MAQCTETQPIRTVNFSPDGKRIAIGTNGCALKICAVPSESQFDQIARVLNRSISANLKLKTLEDFEDLHLGSVYATSFSRDGKLIATASNDMTVKVVRLGTGGVERKNVHDDNEGSDGREGTVEDGRAVTFVGHEGTVRDVAFCGDNSRIVSGGAGDFILDYGMFPLQMKIVEALLTMKGHTNCIYALNCDIEGKRETEWCLVPAQIKRFGCGICAQALAFL